MFSLNWFSPASGKRLSDFSFMTRVFLLICLLAGTGSGIAQTQFWSDTFEDTGAPSSGSRTPSYTGSFGGPPATRYFFRTAVSGIALQNGTYSALQGTKMWAGEDLDAIPTGTNNEQSANQTITWSGINIAGKTNLSFKGLFAANNFGGANWEGTSFGAAQDFLVVEYRINGGAWTKGLGFYSNNVLNGTLSRDNNNDLVGDGIALDYAFIEFGFNISGTGTTLDLRFNCFANGSATEEFAIDNFRLFFGSVTPLHLLSFSGTHTGNGDLLSWHTANEVNVDRFEVENSADALSWKKLAALAAQNSTGNNQYTYTHSTSSTHDPYYRLKMIDRDGSFRYSPVVVIRAAAPATISIYPNPVKNHFILNLPSTGPADVMIVNSAGQILSRIRLTDQQRYYIPAESLKPGWYSIVIVQDGKRRILRIRK